MFTSVYNNDQYCTIRFAILVWANALSCIGLAQITLFIEALQGRGGSCKCYLPSISAYKLLASAIPQLKAPFLYEHEYNSFQTYHHTPRGVP